MCMQGVPGATNRLLPVEGKRICDHKGASCPPECHQGAPHRCDPEDGCNEDTCGHSGVRCSCVEVSP